MRFIARLPREGINVSHEHPLVDALTLTLGLAAILVVVVAVFMFFVDIVIFFVSPRTEARVFSKWPVADLVAPDYEHEDAAVLQRLVDRLANHAEQAGTTFRVGISEQSEPSALARPGGYIVVTRGLPDQAESENELAFVLAHEIAHFEHRDHLRQLGRGVALGLILAIVSGHDGGLVSNGVVNVTAMSFGRKQESAADSRALELVFAEYGHVDQSWRFFERMGATGLPFEKVGGYFATHPSFGDRVARLKLQATANGWPLTGTVIPLAR